MRDLPQGYRDADQLKKDVADQLTALSYAEGMKALQKGEYASAERFLTEARSAGGHAPPDLEEQLARATELREQAEEAARIAAIRENQNYFSSGPVRIAVGNAEFRSSVGYTRATGNGVFVLVYVTVLNEDLRSDHANPHNFRLTAPDGTTVSHHTETYALSRYFDAVDLNKGQKTAGWLVFYTVKADTYTLHYDSLYASTTKTIAPE